MNFDFKDQRRKRTGLKIDLRGLVGKDSSFQRCGQRNYGDSNNAAALGMKRRNPVTGCVVGSVRVSAV